MLKSLTKKKVVTIGVIGLLLSVIISAIVIKKLPDDTAVCSSVTVSVENGVCTPAQSEFVCSLSESGKRIIDLEWGDLEAKQGFITAATVIDEAGEEKCFITGGALRAEMHPMELEKGTYTVKLNFITTEDEYYSIMNEHKVDKIEAFDFEPIDGNYEMEYRIDIHPNINFKTIGIIYGLVVGIFVVLIVCALTKNGDRSELKYDERQLAARGKAFKGGFFTILIMNFLAVIFTAAEISIPIDSTLAMLISCFLGMLVFLGIAIWENAYYALNENGRNVVIAFTIIGLINFVIGIINLRGDEVIVNGVVQGEKCMNFMCALLFIYIAMVTAIRVYVDKKADESVDENEEILTDDGGQHYEES